MQKKLIFSYITIILIAILISGVAFWFNGYDYILDQSDEYYLSKTKLIADVFEDEVLDNQQDYQAFISRYGEKHNIRITLIDLEGNVFKDSLGQGLNEYHGDREEFKLAVKGKSALVNRFSITMGEHYSYAAVPVENGDFIGVLRTAMVLSEITTLNSKLIKSIVITIISCFIIAIIVAIAFTRILAKPIIEVSNAATRISKGELDIRIYTRETDQIGMLARAFNVMAVNLRENIDHLTERNIELEAMLTSFSGGVVAINDSNEILYYNKAFSEVCKSQEDMKGKSLFNVFRHLTIIKTVEEVRLLSKPTVNEGIVSNALHIRVTATPLVSHIGVTFGVLLIIEDITKIRKLENMRRDFVSNVTHELKTPLTSIRGFIDTLKRGALKDEVVANRFIDIIDLEAERLYVLIQDILILSEIESRKEEERIDFDINESIESVIELLEPKLTKDVTIVFQKIELSTTIYCNPDRMKQLFINVLDNAIKYTERGTIHITCMEENQELVITIKDTGIGVNKEHLERIFERFYRVDRGRTRKQGGTGLGLSIVKHIVDRYNGTITVNSKLNEGTEFIIRFPVQKKSLEIDCN